MELRHKAFKLTARVSGVFAPCVESLLRLTEDFINAFCCIELFVHLRSVALIGKCKLILEFVALINDNKVISF